MAIFSVNEIRTFFFVMTLKKVHFFVINLLWMSQKVYVDRRDSLHFLVIMGSSLIKAEAGKYKITCFNISTSQSDHVDKLSSIL